MKAAIIDDLAACRGEIRACLNRYLDENYAGETPVIEDFESGEEFLAHFTPEDYDIIFIDQYMNGLSGMDTAEKIREKDDVVAVVFVTTSIDHAIESFGVRACGYLVKPLSYENYVEVLTEKRGTFRFRIPFGEFTKPLTSYPQFLTCYKGCIVNLERVQRIDELDFVMDTGERVPFSARDRKKIERLFDEYTFQREREDGLE